MNNVVRVDRQRLLSGSSATSHVKEFRSVLLPYDAGLATGHRRAAADAEYAIRRALRPALVIQLPQLLLLYGAAAATAALVRWLRSHFVWYIDRWKGSFVIRDS